MNDVTDSSNLAQRWPYIGCNADVECGRSFEEVSDCRHVDSSQGNIDRWGLIRRRQMEDLRTKGKVVHRKNTTSGISVEGIQ